MAHGLPGEPGADATETRATPRPWHISEQNPEYVDTHDGYYIAGCEKAVGNDMAESSANAALIVRCVNQHDALVSWLTKAAQLAEQQYTGGDDVPLNSAWIWLAANARAALNAAKAE